MRWASLILLSFVFAATLAAQDTRNWSSLAQLKPGDQVLLSLARRSPVTGAFQSWTPEQVTVADVSASMQDVQKVERSRDAGRRGKRIALGALIGFGGGFALGAAAGGNCGSHFGPCISRGALGGAVGAGGAAAGTLIGAVLPHRSRQVIYTAK